MVKGLLYVILAIGITTVAQAKETCGVSTALHNYEKSTKDPAALLVVLNVLDNNAKHEFYTCDSSELPPAMEFIDECIDTLMSKGIAADDEKVRTLYRMKAALQKAIDKSKEPSPA